MAIPFVDNLVCFMGLGMVESMLQPHMVNEAKSTQEQVALTFMIYPIVTVISTPIAGYVRYYFSQHITFENKVHDKCENLQYC